MNKFISKNSDYDLFRKALRSTKNEPVIINILSNDSSLIEDDNKQPVAVSERKQMSTKFQASPFDKFFGPKKKRTDPVDMKDFSSWKNKNYRESEKQINDEPEETARFSFADYLNEKTKAEKFNSEDQVKNETQKSIDQLSPNDEDYKRFSLDSYLNKLEQESKVKKDFEQTEDLIDSNFGEDLDHNISDDQDENFIDSTSVDVEDIVHGGDVGGEKFAFDREELDTFKARLDKMEREANNIKEKQTSKLISADEIKEIKGEDDEEFSLDKLGFEDDIEQVNEKINSLNKALEITGDDETETPKVEHKKFFEVNKNFSDDGVKSSDDENISSVNSNSKDAETDSNLEENRGSSTAGVNISINQSSGTSSVSGDKNDDKNIEGNVEGVVSPKIIVGAVSTDDLDEISEDAQDNFIDVVQIPGSELGGEQSANDFAMVSSINKDKDYLTKSDFKNFTEEIVNKFSEMYRGNNQNGQMDYVSQQPYSQMGVQGYEQNYTNGDAQFAGTNQQAGVYQQSDLSSKISELIEQNKIADKEIAEKLQLAELEKQRVAEQYETRLRELEESMKKREEEIRQEAYIEKLRNDIKFKKSESKYKLREEKIRETEKLISEKQLASEKLKAELKNCLNVSNLEMDKKLLECVNKLSKEKEKENEEFRAKIESETKEVEEDEVKPARPRSRGRTSTRRRTSTVKSRMRTRTPRRKIDSDIIGGIDFD